VFAITLRPRVAAASVFLNAFIVVSPDVLIMPTRWFAAGTTSSIISHEEINVRIIDTPFTDRKP
jgi:hypothetical protein